MTDITARQALRQLAAGTTMIIRGILWSGEWHETLARWILAAIAGSLALTGAALHPWLWPILAILWLGAASAAAPPLADDPDDEHNDEPDPDGDDRDDEQLLDLDAFTELVGDVADGRNVHLIEIRRQLAIETGREWSGPAVTALCEAAGIRVRAGVRVPGAQPAVTTGIHHTDLPPLPDPYRGAPVDVDAAGQHPNNNTNKPEVERIGEGGALIKARRSNRQGARR